MLEGGEAGHPGAAERHHFAVENGPMAGQCGSHGVDFRVRVCDVDLVAGDEAQVVAVDVGDRAHAVPFELVAPALVRRQRAERSEQIGRAHV